MYEKSVSTEKKNGCNSSFTAQCSHHDGIATDGEVAVVGVRVGRRKRRGRTDTGKGRRRRKA